MHIYLLIVRYMISYKKPQPCRVELWNPWQGDAGALEEGQHYLEGTPCQFEVWTDHKNLEYFCMSKKLNWRQAQRSLHLSWIDFMLHHHLGHSMGKSDALSCHADHRSGGGDNADMTMLTPSLFTIRALEGVTAIRAEVEVLWDIQR